MSKKCVQSGFYQTKRGVYTPKDPLTLQWQLRSIIKLNCVYNTFYFVDTSFLETHRHYSYLLEFKPLYAEISKRLFRIINVGAEREFKTILIAGFML